MAEAATDASEQVVTEAAGRLRARDFQPAAGLHWRTCEVRTVRGPAQLQVSSS